MGKAERRRHLFKLEKSHKQPNMKLYVPGRLYFPQNKPDLRWDMQSYEQITLKRADNSALVSSHKLYRYKDRATKELCVVF